MPHRPKNADRLTPDYDEWLETLRGRLEPRGAKSDLARYIARRCQVNALSQRSVITAILARRFVPGAPFVCTANAWMRAAATAERDGRQ